jgi:hypothetical protein
MRLVVLVVALAFVWLALPAHANAAPQATPVAQSGSLRLCKAAGAGVTAGDPFTFSLTTQSVTRTITVAAGSCTTLVVGTRADAQTKGFFANHAAAVSALLGSGVTLKVDGAQLTGTQVLAILTATPGNPGGVTASSSALMTLAQQLLAADLNVLLGAAAPPSVIAAVAQANAALQISVNGGSIQLTTALTTAQLSALIDTLTAFNGGKLGGPGSGAASVGITEAPVTNIGVSAISCSPSSACSNIDLTSRSVTAVVSSGATTEVRFTNESNLGNLKLCKVAGTGIAAGTNFTFTVTVGTQAPQTVTVAAGDCVFVNGILDGTSVVVAETLSSSFRVFSIACNPGCSNIDLNGATATIPIKRNSDAVLTFTNESTS